MAKGEFSGQFRMWEKQGRAVLSKPALTGTRSVSSHDFLHSVVLSGVFESKADPCSVNSLIRLR